MDYDIDKAFILGYNFDEYGRFITWSPLQILHTDDLFNRSMKLPLPTGKKLNLEYEVSSEGQIDSLMDTLVKDYLTIQPLYIRPELINDPKIIALLLKYGLDPTINGQDELENNYYGLNISILTEILKRLEQVGGLFVSEKYTRHPNFETLKQSIDRHNLSVSSDAGYKNYATYQMHLIMLSPKNATTTYKSIDVATDAFNDPIGEIPMTLTYNLDNGWSIPSMTASGAVGKDDVGIAANGTKAQFTLLNYFNRIFDTSEPLTKEELEQSHYFSILDLDLTYDVEKELADGAGNPIKNTDGTTVKVTDQKTDRFIIGPIADTQMSQAVRALYEGFTNGNGLHLYDQDAAQSVGALLSMAADNAKTLNLDKMHAETDYFAMHIFLAMNGVPADTIVKFFNSTAFKNIISGAQNDLAKGKIPKIEAKTFAKNKQLYVIYQCAAELTRLALILSINQGIKVDESEMVAQKQKLETAYQQSLADRGVLDTSNGLMTDEGMFNVDSQNIENNIYERFSAYGGAEAPVIIQRMQRANKLMKLAGITLLDKFNLNRFLTDDTYKEAIKTITDVVKWNYNVFDVIDKVPHFQKMIKKYSELINTMTASSTMLDVMINQAANLYNPGILEYERANPEAEIYEDEFELPYTYTKKMVKYVREAVTNTMFEGFLKDIASDSSFVYKGQGMELKCSFKTDTAVQRFMDFMNQIVFPRLFEHKDNAFIENLTINSSEALRNHNVLFSSVKNLRVLENSEMQGVTLLFKIRQDFNKIKDITLKELLANEDFEIYDAETTVGDFIYLYNTIAKTVNPRINSFDSVFTEFGERDMQTRYYQYVKEFDTGKRLFRLDPKILMATIVKGQVKDKWMSSDKTNSYFLKCIRFTDGTKPLVLRRTTERLSDQVKTYELTYMMGMDKVFTIDPTIEFGELLKNALSNNRIQIIDYKKDC